MVTKAGAAQEFLEAVISHGPQPTCVHWPFATNGVGYGVVGVRVGGQKKMALVTRIVCGRTHGPAPEEGMYAAHSCGKGHEACCNPGCLYWATPKQNQADRIKHGTDANGPKNGAAKLTTEDVIAIRSNPTGLKGKDLATLFGVSGQQISKIRLGLRRAVS